MIVVLLFVIIILSGFIIFLLLSKDFNNNPSSNNNLKIADIPEFTYDDCINKVIMDARKLKPASDEIIGAKRQDEYQITWTKTRIGWWDSDRESGAADQVIDEMLGGIK